MTDNDIINALECCALDDSLLCTECPYLDVCDRDAGKIIKDAIALINRQKAEIDGLNELVSLSIDTQNDFSDTITKQKAEICELEAYANQLKCQRDAWKEAAEIQTTEVKKLRKMLADAYKKIDEYRIRVIRAQKIETNAIEMVRKEMKELVGERE